MQKVLLLRFGEIFLKGKNRSYFEKLLIENIKAALGGMNYTFAKTHNRYYVEDFDEGTRSARRSKCAPTMMRSARR